MRLSEGSVIVGCWGETCWRTVDIEWEDAEGAKMRMHLTGAETPDPAALGRSFWSDRP